jgi:hypothetical protein
MTTRVSGSQREAGGTVPMSFRHQYDTRHINRNVFAESVDRDKYDERCNISIILLIPGLVWDASEGRFLPRMTGQFPS